MLRRIRSVLENREAGSVLIVTMMIVLIAGGLTIVVLQSSMLTNRDSGVDRQRTVAVDAAESGIDATYAAIQSSSLNPPCTYPSTGTSDVKAFPDPTQVQATITYYDKNQTPLACPLSASAVPAAALIKSTATTQAIAGATNRGVRTMEAYVSLVPIYGNGFNRAIYGKTTIIDGNKSAVYQNSDGSSADLYSDGDIICGNNEVFQGSVIAPNGNINFQNGCSATVSGDLWASGTVTTQSNVTINGRVISSGTNVNLSGNTSVGQTVIANGTIAWSGCSASKNNCLQNMKTSAPPAQKQPFPILRGTSSTTDQWVAAGYQLKGPTAGSCSNVMSDIAAYAGSTTPTLYEVPASCGAVAFSKTNINFKSNFALFAYGGINTSNSVSFTNGAAGGKTLNLYMVVPYDAVASVPCASGAGPVISTSQQFSMDSSLNVLWYTPCDISLSNNTSTNMHGQIFSGSTVTVGNNMSMTFVNTNPLGIDPTSLPTLSYRVDILYKRETHS